MPLNNMTHVNGNKEAIKLLEDMLNIAKTDAIGYAAAVVAKEPNQFVDGFSGTVELEKVGLEALEHLKKRIEESILNRTLPEFDSKLDASYVCYNVSMSPISFDFVNWMVHMEMLRIKAGAPAPLKVGFWFGRDGKTGMTGDNTPRDLMLEHVVRPSMKLIGAVEDPIATLGFNKDFFSTAYTCDMFKEGIAVPKFKSDVSISYEPGYVTITLRETSYWPHRNSKMKDWLQFAEYLKSKGERVIFIRDTANADLPIEGYPTDPKASRDLLYRTALYNKAKCNLFVTNGPASIALYTDVPWLEFVDVDDQGAYNASTSKFWKECVGVEVGGQFPWSNPKQKIVWKSDYYTNLVLAWTDLWKEESGA